MYKSLLCFFTICLSSQSVAIEYCADSWKDWVSDCTHLTASTGLSYLAPEPYSSSTWEIDNHWGKGIALRLGGRISNTLFAELSAANLGSASLSNGFSQDKIDYRAAALWSGLDLPWQTKSITPFGKLGIASLSTALLQGNINTTAQNSIHIAIGAGVRAELNDHWQIRLETDLYTRDARQILAGVEYKIADNKNTPRASIAGTVDNDCKRLPISIYFHQNSASIPNTNMRTIRKIMLITEQLNEPTLTIKGLALKEEGNNARMLANQRAISVFKRLETSLTKEIKIEILPLALVDESTVNMIESALLRRVDISISASGNVPCSY